MDNKHSEYNDSDDQVYCEGMSYLFERYLFLPAIIGIGLFLLLAMAGCVLRYMDGGY